MLSKKRQRETPPKMHLTVIQYILFCSDQNIGFSCAQFRILAYYYITVLLRFFPVGTYIYVYIIHLVKLMRHHWATLLIPIIVYVRTLISISMEGDVTVCLWRACESNKSLEVGNKQFTPIYCKQKMKQNKTRYFERMFSNCKMILEIYINKWGTNYNNIQYT